MALCGPSPVAGVRSRRTHETNGVPSAEGGWCLLLRALDRCAAELSGALLEEPSFMQARPGRFWSLGGNEGPSLEEPPGAPWDLTEAS